MAGHYANVVRRTPADFIRVQKTLIVKMEGAQLGNNLLRLMTKEGEFTKPYKWKPITFKQRFEELLQLLEWFDTWEVPMPDAIQWKRVYIKNFTTNM